MRRPNENLWPTRRRKREQRRGYVPRVDAEQPPSLDEIAARLVDRGLASTAILGPRRKPWQERKGA